jgi:hypothetical protein
VALFQEVQCSMFASKVKKVVALPSNPSVAVTIHKLSWLQREDAENKSQYAMAKQLAAMGGAEAFQQYQAVVASVTTSPSPSAEPTPAQQEATRLAHLAAVHDALTVLICGVESWTVTPPPSKETLEDLESVDAAFLTREILLLTFPPPSPEMETERKNGESGSTST